MLVFIYLLPLDHKLQGPCLFTMVSLQSGTMDIICKFLLNEYYLTGFMKAFWIQFSLNDTLNIEEKNVVICIMIWFCLPQCNLWFIVTMIFPLYFYFCVCVLLFWPPFPLFYFLSFSPIHYVESRFFWVRLIILIAICNA